MKKIFILIFLILIGTSVFPQIPNPPTLISPLNGATNVSLFPVFQWQASSGATSYRLQILNGPTTVFDQPGITGTSYALTVAVLTGYTSYTWHMNATNASGTSNWSVSWNFTTGISLPSAPVLMIPPNGAVGVSIHPTLDWLGVPGATAYILHVSKSSLFDSLVVCDTTPIAPITLEYNKLYYWRVCAMNSGGIGPWSSIWHFTTVVSAPPDPPVLLSPLDSAINIPITNVTFDWTDVPGATSYRIQISMSSDFGTTFVNTQTTTSQYTYIAPIFSYNTTYYWRVNATNSSGTGQWSSVRRFTTIPQTLLPPILYPVNRGKPVYADSSTIFEWHKVSSATSYRIQIATSPGFPNPIIDLTVFDTIYIAPPNKFIEYTQYYWRVAAINQGGQGAWSSFLNFRVLGSPLNQPILNSPQNNSTNISLTPVLDWFDVTAASYYRVQVSTSNTFTNFVLNISGLPNSGYNVQPGILNTCTIYYWRAKAYVIGDSSAWSDVWSFTTTCPPGVKNISSEIPSEYKLYNNFPNPFNPKTIIRFQIKDSRFVTLKVFDILGREVEKLVNEKLSPGIYEVIFDGNNLPSGMYFYTIHSGDFTDTKRMLLVK